MVLLEGIDWKSEWIMICGFRVEPGLKKRFEKNMKSYGYRTMTAAFRDFMRQVAEGSFNTKPKQETMIDNIKKKIEVMEKDIENIKRGI